MANNLELATHVEDKEATNVQTRFGNFLRNFTSPVTVDGEEQEQTEYLVQLDQMAADGRTTLFVAYDHVLTFDEPLARAVHEEFYRFERYLRVAIQLLVKERHAAYSKDGKDEHGRDIEKEFWVGFYRYPTILKLRQLKTNMIGRLVSISGTVTRTSEVRPELMLGHFSCVECAYPRKNVEQQFKYTEPNVCANPACSNRTKWSLNTHLSRFVDFQRVRLQENTADIPSGSMPRTLDVILRHEIVEKAKAGDKCCFTGQLLVVPDVAQLSKPGERVTSAGQSTRGGDLAQGVTGLKALGVRDLTFKLVFLANSVIRDEDAHGETANIRGDEGELQMSREDQEEVFRMSGMHQLYESLVRSVAPTVFGHEEVKRGVLLMLFGGNTKTTKLDKAKLRGDLNVCIVGDPGTAKSQFLKYVVSFLPRAVYASGKASSAAGLTATVAMDPETGEYGIEAGALMLADNGICCIDEFDKMDMKDQVAIHEAMEQQTITLAKAGIHATLNARTSILAAANPKEGRYDKSKSLRYNINMPAPIMSRFDLFFVIVDEPNDTTDYNIARHMVSLHKNGMTGAALPDFSKEELQRYIRYARTFKPQITPEAKAAIVENYRKLRQADVVGNARSYRITVRQLESMIRLSEALARLHCDKEVKAKYVHEAARLLRQSIIKVDNPEIDVGPDEDDNAGGGGGDGGEGGDGGDKPDGQEDDNVPKPALKKMPFEEYKRMANMLVLKLRRPENEEKGMMWRDLVEWYLTEQLEKIDTEVELLQQKQIVDKVISRLIRADRVLIDLTKDDEDIKEDDDRILAVHPNYTVQS